MATISLYKDKLNGVGGLLDRIVKSVNNLDTQLDTLKDTLQGVNSSTCNLEDTVNSISSSSKSEKQKVEDLKKLNGQLTTFIETTTKRDKSARDEINKRKEDFYTQYKHLKPECEKSKIEKIVDSIKSAAEWCKEHWKLIVTIALVVVAVVVIVCTAGAALGPFATIAVGAAKGLLIGAAIGGVSGGLESMASGGSFLEGFENGAFAGAISGAFSGALGGAGAYAGKFLKCTSKVGKFVKRTAKVTDKMSDVMDGMDTLAYLDGKFGGGKFAEFNEKLNSNKAYNYFKNGVSATSTLTGGMDSTMKCFVAGTLVLTPTELVPIEQIKAGDVVISTDPDTMETAHKTVLDAFVLEADKLVHLVINGEEIVTTYEHPFYVKGQGFVNAVDLCIGTELLDAEGRTLHVEDIYREVLDGETRTVYNFKVEDFHTYYVGESSVWVHNLTCGQTSTAFDQKNFASTADERIARTPSLRNKNVKFEGARGMTKCVPRDPNSSLAKTLNECGVDGIEYKNGVPDLSPTSKGEVKIDHMVGGTGKMGTKARQWNFGQADNAMAMELNADPATAKSLGITPKNGTTFTSSDVSAYRKNNGLTWHELNDAKTMQLVPTEVNAKFSHLGGVGEINAGAYDLDGFAH